MSRGNEPAYPVTAADEREILTNGYGAFGITLREHYAGLAMAALIQQGATLEVHTDDGVLRLPSRVGVPRLALEYADALLAALQEPK